jgi:hypothetical protein
LTSTPIKSEHLLATLVDLGGMREYAQGDEEELGQFGKSRMALIVSERVPIQVRPYGTIPPIFS